MSVSVTTTIQEHAPYKNLTGKVQKAEQEPFAGGGYSDVFRGTLWAGSGHVIYVAIKILREQITDADARDKIRRRFLRESRVWDTLDHENVLPFLGFSFDFGRFPALVSPYCQNSNAVEYLRKNPHTNRFGIIIGTAKGLEYLHSKHVVHGDIKGLNVLIDDRGIARLSDFGRSLILQQTGFTTDLAGSAKYMAPELFGPVPNLTQNDVTDADNFVPRLTKASDVYAFIMVLLELLTGQAPWYWSTPAQVILRVPVGLRPTRSRYNSAMFNDKHWRLLEECWVGEPAGRPSMTEVVRRLVSF